jgi:prefoldin subunit 5
MLMIAVFAISVSCCLVAIGAFLLLTTILPDSPGEPQPIPPQEDIKDKIAQADERIAQLQNELNTNNNNAEAARKISETINFLKSAMLKLQENNSLLGRKILEINTNVQQMDIQNKQEG